jgi:hypothetical protein
VSGTFVVIVVHVLFGLEKSAGGESVALGARVVVGRVGRSTENVWFAVL